jgi:Fis family transcriptional regulator, factor for inversion stimulation protein
MKPLIGEPRQTLRSCVSSVLNDYFAQVEPEMINGLYQMVLSEVEAPLLEAVMQKARSNQSVAAQMLGLNRGTLRKKLRQYDLLE